MRKSSSLAILNSAYCLQVVFVVGGATYEEARDVQNLQTAMPGQRIVLGGTTVHNSRSFLADLGPRHSINRARDWPSITTPRNFRSASKRANFPNSHPFRPTDDP